MAELADGFVAQPGGIGTLEELFEIVTWSQLGIHRKPIGVLSVAGCHDPLVARLDHAVAGLVIVDEAPARLLDRMADHEPPSRPAWISPEET
ncbi:MAG TPA: LOG family protein [Vicinamibacteria bacterium]|nr:LOG family protein [Vicinamibacteria bacterium]